jgi:ABC-type glycerol-3-phosphate transport system permease component
VNEGVSVLGLPGEKTVARRATAGRNWLADALVYGPLLVGAVFMLVPFVWLVSSAFKDEVQIFTFPPEWIPDPIRWDNITRAMTILPFHLFAFNTMKVTFLATVGTLVSSSLVAYGFARLRAPGKSVLFLILLSTLMLPYQVVAIPHYWLFSRLDWVNTHLPLWVPYWFANPFHVFLLRQFFLSIPREIEDAAKIDGASWLDIWWRIILPLSKPALITIVIFQFLASWNDFFGPLVYLSRQDLFTLTLGLNYFRTAYTIDYELMMGAALVIMLPCIILFFVAQRYFIEGISMSGIKG